MKTSREVFHCSYVCVLKVIAMKVVKGTDLIINAKGMLYQSYHQGWTKALENFEKNRQEYLFQDKQYFRLHEN